MNSEFYFPLKKEQLLEKPSDNRFWVRDLFISTQIEEKLDLEELDLRKQRDILDAVFSNLDRDSLAITNQENFTYLFSFIMYCVILIQILRYFRSQLKEFLNRRHSEISKEFR